MGDCGVTCAKYSVFIFNLLFALTGIAILTVGTYIYIAYEHYATFIGDQLWTTPVIMMAIGGVVFLIAFLGCCGAIKESSCMVLTFSILLILIFLVEIGVGVAGYTQRNQLKPILDKGFNYTLNHYESNKDAWKIVQTELYCCGVNGPRDWKNETLPVECCPQKPIDKSCTLEYANQKGCEPVLLEYLESKSIILASVGIGIGLIQLIGLGYACCLYRAFRKNYEAV